MSSMTYKFLVLKSPNLLGYQGSKTPKPSASHWESTSLCRHTAISPSYSWYWIFSTNTHSIYNSAANICTPKQFWLLFSQEHPHNNNYSESPIEYFFSSCFQVQCSQDSVPQDTFLSLSLVKESFHIYHKSPAPPFEITLTCLFDSSKSRNRLNIFYAAPSNRPYFSILNYVLQVYQLF